MHRRGGRSSRERRSERGKRGKEEEEGEAKHRRVLLPENAVGVWWAWKEATVACRKPSVDCDQATGGVQRGVRRDVGETRIPVATATCFAATCFVAWAGPWACTFQCTAPFLPFPPAFAACEGSFLHGRRRQKQR